MSVHLAEARCGAAASPRPHPSYSDVVLQSVPYIYYKLDETSGTDCLDSSGNGFDGTYDAEITLDQPGPGIGIPRSADFGAYTDNYAMLAGDVAGDVSGKCVDGFTLECWMKGDGDAWHVSGSSEIFWMPSNTGFYLRITGNKLATSARFVTSGQQFLAGTTTIDTSTWYHCVATWDRTGDATMRLYLNGVLEATDVDAFDEALSTDVNPQTTLGYFASGSNVFGGLLCHAALYTHALSATEIAAHYAAAWVQ